MTALQIINTILIFLSQFIRIVGLAALGVALGWLVLDMLRKAQVWAMEAVLYLGLLGFVIAMVIFTGWGAAGAFAIGLAVAIFLWGMPRKPKVEEEKKE